MQNGTEMIKLRTNVRQFKRVFSLDADLSHIRWTPTNKKPHKARSKFYICLVGSKYKLFTVENHR